MRLVQGEHRAELKGLFEWIRMSGAAAPFASCLPVCGTSLAFSHLNISAATDRHAATGTQNTSQNRTQGAHAKTHYTALHGQENRGSPVEFLYKFVSTPAGEAATVSHGTTDTWHSLAVSNTGGAPCALVNRALKTAEPQPRLPHRSLHARARVRPSSALREASPSRHNAANATRWIYNTARKLDLRQPVVLS